MGRHSSFCGSVLASLLLWTSACVFDASGLGECRSDGECAGGRCVDQVCVPSLAGDSGGDRADGLPDLDEDAPTDNGEDLDLGEDAPDGVGDADDGGADGPPDGDDAPDLGDDAPVCPPEPFCDDKERVFCDELGGLQRLDCDDDASCDDADLGCRCDDGACVARECLPNAQDCVGDQVVQCDGEGASFTVLEVCDVLDICVGGACTPNSCEPDTTFCLGEVVVSCSSEGELEIVADCRIDDGYCSEVGPACEERNCDPGARRCATDPESGATIVEQCDARGLGFELLEPCAETQTCSNGQCEGPICTPGEAPNCLGTSTRVVCNSAGSGYDSVPCGEGFYCDDVSEEAICLEGVCTPATSQCLPGEQFETCNEAGSGYDPPESCDGDEFCAGGACLEQVCTPGAVACDDDFTLRYCNDNGSEEVVEPCPEDEYCDANAVPIVCVPQVCEPDAALCNDEGDAVMCDSLGSSTTPLETCEFTCFMGECRDPYCGDGLVTPANLEECDDRNDLQCDGCEDCLELFSLGITATTDSLLSRPQWVPGQSLLTVEAWVRVTASGELAGIGESATDNGRLFVTAGGQPAFFLNLGNSQTIQVTGPTSILDGAWHHLAGQRTGIDDLSLYVDGELADSAVGALTSISLDDGDLWIGAETLFVPGAARVDEVRFSDVVRYTSTFTPARTLSADGDTMALYHLDHGTGVTATDSSGNDRHITLENVSWSPDDCYGGAVNP